MDHGSWSTAPASSHNTDHSGELCNAWQMMVNMVNRFQNLEENGAKILQIVDTFLSVSIS